MSFAIAMVSRLNSYAIAKPTTPPWGKKVFFSFPLHNLTLIRYNLTTGNY